MRSVHFLTIAVVASLFGLLACTSMETPTKPVADKAVAAVASEAEERPTAEPKTPHEAVAGERGVKIATEQASGQANVPLAKQAPVEMEPTGNVEKKTRYKKQVERAKKNTLMKFLTTDGSGQERGSGNYMLKSGINASPMGDAWQMKGGVVVAQGGDVGQYVARPKAGGHPKAVEKSIR